MADTRDRRQGKKEWRGRRPKRKNCQFCMEKAEAIDYKDVSRLRRFAGTCARHQRVLATALKRSRELALLPYTAE